MASVGHRQFVSSWKFTFPERKRMDSKRDMPPTSFPLPLMEMGRFAVLEMVLFGSGAQAAASPVAILGRIWWCLELGTASWLRACSLGPQTQPSRCTRERSSSSSPRCRQQHPAARQDLPWDCRVRTARALHHAVPHVVIYGGKQVQRAIEPIW